MPWEERLVGTIREDFVKKVIAGENSKSEICREFNISRPTGDKWLERYRNGEPLSDQSKRPFHSPNKTDEATEAKILAVRGEHPAWGARKIIRVLENRGEGGLPVQSTVCEILKRNGCISHEDSQAAKPFQRFEHDQPNDLWQMDFKGHFPLKNGQRCHPLTILDDHSRYSMCVDAHPNERLPGVAASLTALFRRYGLPSAILCDNGNPWGASQSTGYTQFDIWMMDLDILTIHGRPKHPQTQGKDERFNQTLNDEAIKGREIADMAESQRIFDLFRDCYNNLRPHAALGFACPASRYQPSSRPLPDTVDSCEYPSGTVVRQIKNTGYLTYRNQGYYLSEAFGGRTVAIVESSIPGCVNVIYRNFQVARLNVDEKAFVSRRIYRRSKE